MKILSAAQTREADAYTATRQKLVPGELMERAATAFSNWFSQKFTPEKTVMIFCGPGNNGGDGLAIARLLHNRNYPVQVFLTRNAAFTSPGFNLNLERLPAEITLTYYHDTSELPPVLPETTVVIDALFGSGLNRPLTGIFSQTVTYLNESGAKIIAVDIPSGLFSEEAAPENTAIIKAGHTVSFQLPKLVFMLPGAAEFTGAWHMLPIGLDQEFIASATTRHFFVTAHDIRKIFRPRLKFSHKGTFGHALVLAGSYGKMGTATLATNACLRSGAGLVTAAVPGIGYVIMQLAAPEAMTLTDHDPDFLTVLPPDLSRYQAIGIGPGIGKETATGELLADLLSAAKSPLILDADALNLMAENKHLLLNLPPETILTPHLKEFERLTEPAANDFHRLELLKAFCEQNRCYVILKGAHSCIATPAGHLYFNSTGNPGMATGGSGDVLTGILTSLRAQGYAALETCLLGTYIHGRAGDLAKEKTGETALVAGDLIANLGAAFSELEK